MSFYLKIKNMKFSSEEDLGDILNQARKNAEKLE